MNGTAILVSVIELLTGGITAIGSAIGTGISNLVSNIALTQDGDLSVFATFVCIFAGIGLAISLSKLLVRWISSLGGSNV